MQKKPGKDEISPQCPWEEELSAYLLGEISAPVRAQVENHLSGCFFCQEQLRELRDTVAILRRAPSESLSRDLTVPLRQKISKETRLPALRQPQYARKTMRFGVTAIFCCCVTLAFFHFFTKTRHVPALSQSTAVSEVVSRSLGWLVKTQEPNGSWNSEKWGGSRAYTVGVSGLALLALSKGCSPSADSSYRECITRTAEYLVKEQNEDGLVGPQSNTALYNHGIATTALLETYAVLRTNALAKPIGRAVHYICSRQIPTGGWGDPNKPPNLSVSVWQLHALVRAQALGWKDTGPNIARGLNWIAQLLDTETLPKFAMQEKNVDYGHRYFLPYALCSISQDSFFARLAPLHTVLGANQIRTGNYRGSWEPADQWGRVGGRVYTTALATLALQVDLGSSLVSPANKL